LKKIKKKKSSGHDGLRQEHLVLGSNVLVNPLTTIINESISKGEFSKVWKGSPGLLENYRPLSCLPAASKLLERTAYDQVAIFFNQKTSSQ
jgi:hypothetical protein